MWVVILEKPPVVNPWKSDYFPRTFAYKKEAKLVADQVSANGGKARVEKAK